MNAIRTGFRYLALAPLAAIVVISGCTRANENRWQGYIEGEFVYVSSPLAGRLEKLSVSKGARVAAGTPLFELERAAEAAALRQASQQLKAAKAQLEDLRKGSRPEEIAALEARLGQSRAAAELSRLELVRQEALFKSAAISASDFDHARLTHEADLRAVDEDQAKLETARLGGRADAVAAASAEVHAAADAEAHARWSVDQKAQSSSVSALVFDTLYREGEFVAAGSPVVSLLPPANIKVRFFVPERELGRIRAGDHVKRGGAGTSRPARRRRELSFPPARIHPPRPLQPGQQGQARVHGGGRVRAGGRGRPSPRTARRRRAGGKMTAQEELVIDVAGVTKRFDGKTVVNGINLQVRKGEIYGFLGPNGSGKTTFIRMLCGLLTPDGGSGTCLGHDILRQQDLIKREVGYMTQRFSYYEDLSIRENLDFIARIYGIADRESAVNASLDRLGLRNRSGQLAGELSGGWKQRLALAACLIHRPQLLLLDEPTAGVDPKARREFWDEIHRLSTEGITLLITTHYMDEAERCHRIACLAYGSLLVRGTVSEVIASAGLETWCITGPGLSELAEALKGQDGVEQVVPFGSTIHVSGRETGRLESTLSRLCSAEQPRSRIESGLEDVFIALMDHAKDNFG